MLGMPGVNEWAFFHNESKTLILTDLLFNICNSKSWITRMVMRLNRAYNKLSMTRISRSFIEDKQLWQSSIQKILDWDFDKIILAHGDPILENGKSEFEQAVKCFLEVPEATDNELAHV